MVAPTASISSLQLDSWDAFSASSEFQVSTNIAVATRSQTATVLAQFEGDVLEDIGGAFQNFYESGQIWALRIGLVLGYVVRGITTYK